MNDNNKNNIWKYFVYTIVGIICLLVAVYLINLLIITKVPFRVAQDNDWISFWGSVLGAIISGITTFTALKITINNENKKRLEDKRLSICPYLTYSFEYENCQEYFESNCNEENRLEIPLIIEPKGSGVDKYYQFILIIKNLGLGTCVKPKINKIYYDEKNNTNILNNEIAINVNDKAFADFKIVYLNSNEDVGQLRLVINYYNLLRDYYELEITIDFTLSSIKDTINEEGKLLNREFSMKPYILKVSQAKIIKDKNN